MEVCIERNYGLIMNRPSQLSGNPEDCGLEICIHTYIYMGNDVLLSRTKIL